MFEAFIVVCALNMSGEIDQGNCIRLDDALGPYETMAECEVRGIEMSNVVLEGSLSFSIFQDLGYPEMVYVEGLCTKNYETGV